MEPLVLEWEPIYPSPPLLFCSDEMTDVAEAVAGDIVAIFGVDCSSGETFTGGDKHVPGWVESEQELGWSGRRGQCDWKGRRTRKARHGAPLGASPCDMSLALTDQHLA